MVWVRLEDGVRQRDSTTVEVPSNAIVDDVIDPALFEMKQGWDPSLVTATLNEKELRRDHEVSSLTTSCNGPILLTVNQAYQYEGM